MKDQYNLELQTPETTESFGGTKNTLYTVKRKEWLYLDFDRLK